MIEEPQDFQGAGRVLWAKHSLEPPPFIKPQRIKDESRLRGIRYERKVQDYLCRTFEGYIPSPWIYFRSSQFSRTRWAQPDGLLLDLERGICTIIEIKYQHTKRAYFQLHRLYYPLLTRILRPELWSFRFLEIVRWYDPSASFPVIPRMSPIISDIPEGCTGVHIWKP